MLIAQEVGHDWILTGLVALAAAFATLIPAVAGALVLLLNARTAQRKEKLKLQAELEAEKAERTAGERKDAIIEWQQLFDRERTRNGEIVQSLRVENQEQQRQINDLMNKIDAVRAESHERGNNFMKAIADCHREHVDDIRKIGELSTTVARLEVQLKTVQAATGTSVPNTPLSGIVIADLDGIIQEFSPALTPIFKWLPEDVRGKSITVLMPPDEIARHKPAFTMAVKNPEAINHLVEIHAIGLDKLGNCIPISLSVHGWRSGGKGLITATIKQRVVTSPAEFK